MKKFLDYSIFLENLPVLVAKGGQSICFQERLPCRGEVIPLEADEAGTGNSKQAVWKILH